MTLRREQLIDGFHWAVGVVDEARVPADLRPAAFARALDAVGIATTPHVPHSMPSATPLPRAPEDGLLTRIALALELPENVVGRIYDEDAGEINLILRKDMLPTPESKAGSMRDVALLVAVGRQVAELEDYTAFSVIRNECADLGVLDSPNFATEVGKLGMRQRGGRNAREAKANRHHRDDAATLIRGIVANGGA